MTRLVGVRAVCDGCSAAAATVFCVSHRNVMCPPCDRVLHSNSNDRNHQRVDLASAVTALPFCEYCDNAPATTYCESEGSTLCDKCDQVVHKSTPTPHWRTSIERTLRNRAVEFHAASSSTQNERQPSVEQQPINNINSSTPSQPEAQSPSSTQIFATTTPTPRVSSSPDAMSIDVHPIVSPTATPDNNILNNQNQSINPYSQQKSIDSKHDPLNKSISSREPKSKTNSKKQTTSASQNSPDSSVSLPTSLPEAIAATKLTGIVNTSNIDDQSNIPGEVPKSKSIASGRSRSYNRQGQRQTKNLGSETISQPSPRKRAAKALAKRNNRRASKPDITSSSMIPTFVQSKPQSPIFDTGDYGDILNSQLNTDLGDASAPSYSGGLGAFSTELIPQSHSFGDPIIINNDTESAVDPFGDDTGNMELGNIGSYSRFGLENEPLSEVQKHTSSPQDSTEKELKENPSTKMREPSDPLQTEQNPNSNDQRSISSVAAVAAAAAAAAGELYLLNSVSSGSTSSQNPFSPQSDSLNAVSDPAGVAAAATAAAQSAVARTDFRPTLQTNGQSDGSGNTVENTGPNSSESLPGAFHQESQSRENSVSLLQDSIMTKSDDLIRAEQQVFDEAVRKLETNNSHMQPEEITGKEEVASVIIDRTEESGQVESNHPPSISDGVDDSLHNDASLELDLPRPDFDMFDSIDLTNFDHNGSESPDIATTDYHDQESSLDLDDS